MIENTSGLDPRGVAVLIQTYEPERKGALIEIPDTVKGRMDMVDSRAVVIAAGPQAWFDDVLPRAWPGDKVLVTKYAGFMAKGPKDGKMYRLVNDRDVFCAIVDEGDGS
jgi:co-chaperonin GroES (HSP10)